MAAKVESARERTFAERTARFWSMNRKGGPSGPSPRLMRGVTEGIADFTSCRAITRSVDTGGGGLMRRLAGAEDQHAPPIYMLFDGPSMSACLRGHWRDPHPSVPPNPLRGPGGLKFLDLIKPESIVEARGLHPDEDARIEILCLAGRNVNGTDSDSSPARGRQAAR